MNRRKFLKRSVGASMVPALALSWEEKALLGASAGRPSAASGKPSRRAAGTAGAGLPAGKIGDLKISRLICGGNLISGFAHSRDLIYVSTLLKHYFTDEKVFETLEICEEQGINTAILRLDSDTLRILNGYRNERGGKIQWIAQVKPRESDLRTDIDRAVDNGAAAVYVHGGVGDRFVEQGKVDLLGKALEIIKKHKVVSGLAAHALKTVQACHQAGLDPDFYMKTLNSKSYWSAGPRERHDSVWSETPEETIQFMKKVDRPWIAYKVLGAGAIHPREGFRYVFENGADFACVGMFDFQVIEDVIILKKVLSGVTARERAWRA
jgi:hypothetical protein